MDNRDFLSFRLHDDFIEKYKDREPNFGFRDAGGNALGEVTFMRTYSRVKDDGTKERWYEVVERVINGMYSIQKDWAEQNKLPWNQAKAHASAREAYDRMFNFKWTPPGRNLWVGGTEIIHKRGLIAAAYNCSFFSTAPLNYRDPGAVFSVITDALMLGIGVGFDTELANNNIVVYEREESDYTYVIPDTREGWAESVRLLVNSFLRKNKEVHFDYSQIRPAGQPIKGFGGISSGPGPLQKLHKQLTQVFESRQGHYVDSRLVVDIVNLIGTCVVAGNIRRSATIALGEQRDSDFLELKNYEKYPERMEWGWLSNNTVVVGDKDYDYSSVAERIADNGEPGLFFINTARNYGRLADQPDGRDWRVQGLNPCAEITLESFELCNLNEIHLQNIVDLEDLRRTIKFAYLFSKTITLLPVHWPETNAVIQRNRRIGTSMTGIAQFVDEHGLQKFREWADEGYKTVRDYDRIYSEWLGIRESIRVTTVKPSGSVSLLSGATPGVHWPSGGEYYMRAIRFAEDDKMVDLFRHANYKIEKDLFSDRTVVVYFPVKTAMKRSEKDVSIYEKINLAVQAQRYWADNSVSVTVTFDPVNERDDVERVLRMHDQELKSVSFLPMSNEVYPQQPYTEITKQEYEDYLFTLMKIDFSAIYDGVGNLDAVGERYCAGDTCELPTAEEVARAKGLVAEQV